MKSVKPNNISINMAIDNGTSETSDRPTATDLMFASAAIGSMLTSKKSGDGEKSQEKIISEPDVIREYELAGRSSSSDAWFKPSSKKKSVRAK